MGPNSAQTSQERSKIDMASYQEQSVKTKNSREYQKDSIHAVEKRTSSRGKKQKVETWWLTTSDLLARKP